MAAPDPMVRFAQDLVAIPSPSGAEGAAVARAAEEMERLGYDVEVDRAGNAVGRLGSGPVALLLDGHLDTVAANPGWTRDPYAPALEDGRLLGLGALDMKGPVAAAVHGVADAAREGRLARAVAVSATVLEEVMEGAALREVVEALAPAAVVVCEPSDGCLAVAQRGRAEIELVVEGRGAHAAYPEQGVNALLGAAAALQALEADRVAPEHPTLGPGILVATEAATEPMPGISVVPSRARVRFDRRTLPGETEDEVLAELAGAIAAAEALGCAAHAAIVDGTVRGPTGVALPARRFLPAWDAAGSPLEAAGRAALPGAGVRAWAFCTNGSLTSELGIPTLGFGPGDPSGAHQADESIAVADLQRARRDYAALAAGLAS